MDDDRITPLGFIVFSLAIGVFLIAIPWHPLWEKNFLLAYVPTLRVVVLNNYFRGAVSGLGAVDIGLGMVESARLVKAVRTARLSTGPTPPLSE